MSGAGKEKSKTFLRPPQNTGGFEPPTEPTIQYKHEHILLNAFIIAGFCPFGKCVFCLPKNKIRKKLKIFFQSRKEVASLLCRMQARSSEKEVNSGYDGSGKTTSHT